MIFDLMFFYNPNYVVKFTNYFFYFNIDLPDSDSKLKKYLLVLVNIVKYEACVALPITTPVTTRSTPIKTFPRLTSPHVWDLVFFPQPLVLLPPSLVECRHLYLDFLKPSDHLGLLLLIIQQIPKSMYGTLLNQESVIPLIICQIFTKYRSLIKYIMKNHINGIKIIQKITKLPRW